MIKINCKSWTAGLATFLLTLMVAGSARASDHNQTMGLVIGAAAGGLLGTQLGDDGRDYHSYSRYGLKFAKWDNRGNHFGRKFGHPRNFSRYHHDWHYDRDYFNRPHYRHRDDSTRLFATAAGVFIGALIGSEIGRYMDEVDHMRAREANVTAQSAPVGMQITWNNPQTRNSGSITPVRDGYSELGKYCREFYQTVSIGGRTEDAYGVACRQPDGAWRIEP